MPYGLILLVIVVVVAGQFVLSSAASTLAKALVAIASVASIALPNIDPQWSLAALLFQVALVITLLLHVKVRR